MLLVVLALALPVALLLLLVAMGRLEEPLRQGLAPGPGSGPDARRGTLQDL